MLQAKQLPAWFMAGDRENHPMFCLSSFSENSFNVAVDPCYPSMVYKNIHDNKNGTGAVMVSI